jgi:phosphoribosylamine--glycine ligase
MKEDKYNVLLLGSGGREHGIYLSIKNSSRLKSIKVLPGNSGIPKSDRLSLKIDDFEKILSYCKGNDIQFVVIGPEEPLVNGIVDYLEEHNIHCFGPCKFCAQIEGSKLFAKKIMKSLQIPTAKFQFFDKFEPATEYLKNKIYPIVVKYDGLAAGKGVTVAYDKATAEQALLDIFKNKIFGDPCRVIVEEYLEGEECSLFALCDGEKTIPLLPAQDHKQLYEGNRGPNTGGMGAFCPAEVLSTEKLNSINEKILQPIINYFKQIGNPYKGLLYAGLMVNKKKGTVKVLEFNCRFGDPETQIILPALNDDLLDLMIQAGMGKIIIEKLNWNNRHFLTAVLAAPGYPKAYKKNIRLKNIEGYNNSTSWIVHAGTELSGDDENEHYSVGGRILNVVGTGDNLKEARTNAYKLISKINHPELFFRSDIGSQPAT